jgi:hypothetical protein
MTWYSHSKSNRFPAPARSCSGAEPNRYARLTRRTKPNLALVTIENDVATQGAVSRPIDTTLRGAHRFPTAGDDVIEHANVDEGERLFYVLRAIIADLF